MASAAFTVDGLPSEDVNGNRGVVVSNGATVTLQLENIPSGALSATFQLFDATDNTSPLASLNAPALTFDGSGTALELLSDPDNETSTFTFAASGINAYLVRCTVSSATGPVVFERCIVSRGTNSGLRKTFPAESQEFEARGWSDELNRMVDAIEGLSAGGGGNLQTAYDFGAFGGTVTVTADGTNDLNFDTATPHQLGLNLFAIRQNIGGGEQTNLFAPDTDDDVTLSGTDISVLSSGGSDQVTSDTGQSGTAAGSAAFGAFFSGGSGSDSGGTSVGGGGGAGGAASLISSLGGDGGAGSGVFAPGTGGTGGDIQVTAPAGGVGGDGTASVAGAQGGTGGSIIIGQSVASGDGGDSTDASQASGQGGAGGPGILLNALAGGDAGADAGGAGNDGGDGAPIEITGGDGGSATGSGTDGTGGNVELDPGDSSATAGQILISTKVGVDIISGVGNATPVTRWTHGGDFAIDNELPTIVMVNQTYGVEDAKRWMIQSQSPDDPPRFMIGAAQTGEFISGPVLRANRLDTSGSVEINQTTIFGNQILLESSNSASGLTPTVLIEPQVSGGTGDLAELLTLSSQSGTSNADIAFHVGDRDPNGNVTGNPGDYYYRADAGTSSTTYQHQGAAASNSDWIEIGAGGGGVTDLQGAYDGGATITVATNTPIDIQVITGHLQAAIDVDVNSFTPVTDGDGGIQFKEDAVDQFFLGVNLTGEWGMHSNARAGAVEALHVTVGTTTTAAQGGSAVHIRAGSALSGADGGAVNISDGVADGAFVGGGINLTTVAGTSGATTGSITLDATAGTLGTIDLNAGDDVTVNSIAGDVTIDAVLGAILIDSNAANVGIQADLIVSISSTTVGVDITANTTLDLTAGTVTTITGTSVIANAYTFPAVLVDTFNFPNTNGSAGSVLTDLLGDGVLTFQPGGGGGSGSLQDAYNIGTTILATIADGSVTINTAEAVAPLQVQFGGSNVIEVSSTGGINMDSISGTDTAITTTGTGAFTVDSTGTGAVTINSFGGSVSLQHAGGDCVLVAADGSITISPDTNFDTTFTNTGTSGLQANLVNGSFGVNVTGSGDITLENTGSGGIDILATTGNIDIAAFNANIDIDADGTLSLDGDGAVNITSATSTIIVGGDTSVALQLSSTDRILIDSTGTTMTADAGSGAGAGAFITATAGTGGATDGTGGAINLTGGAGGGTNGDGGNVNITMGTLQGTGADGDLQFIYPNGPTYTWPSTLGAAGTVLTDVAGNGVLSFVATGGGGDLQDAYDNGAGTIAVTAAKSIAFSNTVDATSLLTLTSNFAGTPRSLEIFVGAATIGGRAISVDMAAGSAGNGIHVEADATATGNPLRILQGGANRMLVDSNGAIAITGASGQNVSLASSGTGEVILDSIADSFRLRTAGADRITANVSGTVAITGGTGTTVNMRSTGASGAIVIETAVAGTGQLALDSNNGELLLTTSGSGTVALQQNATDRIRLGATGDIVITPGNNADLLVTTTGALGDIAIVSNSTGNMVMNNQGGGVLALQTAGTSMVRLPGDGSLELSSADGAAGVVGQPITTISGDGGAAVDVNSNGFIAGAIGITAGAGGNGGVTSGIDGAGAPINITAGASGTGGATGNVGGDVVLTVGVGSTTDGELQFVVGGTTYVWPVAGGAAGSVLTDVAGNGVLTFAAAGGGGTLQTAYDAGQAIDMLAATGDLVIDATDAVAFQVQKGASNVIEMSTTGAVNVTPTSGQDLTLTAAGFLLSFYPEGWLGRVYEERVKI